MNREKALVNNTIVLGLGMYIPKVVALVTLPIITGSLSKAEYGIYDLIITTVTLALPIAGLQIQSAVFRFLIERRENQEDSGQIITSSLCFVIVVSFLATLLFVLTSRMNYSMGIIIGMYFVFEMLSMTAMQITRGMSKNKIYTMGTILGATVSLIVIVTGFLTNRMSLQWVLVAEVFAKIVAFLYQIIGSGAIRFIRISLLSTRVLKELLTYSWPMIFNNLSMWILRSSDRLVITIFCGIEANAIYAAACKIPTVISNTNNVFVAAWQESASLTQADADIADYYSDVFHKYLVYVTTIAGGLTACSGMLFRLLIKGDYSEGLFQIPILIGGFGFLCISSFFGGIYIAFKDSKRVSVTTAIAAGINLLIDLLLVRRAGITAGSISTLVSMIFLAGIRAYDSRRYVRLQYSFQRIILSVLVLLSICVIIMLQIKHAMIYSVIVVAIYFIGYEGVATVDLLKEILHQKERR